MRVISVMAIALSCVIIAANAYDVNTETVGTEGNLSQWISVELRTGGS